MAIKDKLTAPFFNVNSFVIKHLCHTLIVKVSYGNEVRSLCQNRDLDRLGERRSANSKDRDRLARVKTVIDTYQSTAQSIGYADAIFWGSNIVKSLFVAAAFLVAGAFSANAMTVNFVGQDSYVADDCDFMCKTNKGFVWNQDNWADELSPPAYSGMSADDEVDASSIAYRPDGRRFSVRSVNIANFYDHIQRSGSGPAPDKDEGDESDPTSPYYSWAREGVFEGLLYGFYGLRNGVVVGAYELSKPPLGRLRLGSRFDDIDEFKVTLLFKLSNSYREKDPGGVPDALWCELDTCSYINIGSMNAKIEGPSPVPLPASFPMLVAGLAGLGLWRRKKA